MNVIHELTMTHLQNPEYQKLTPEELAKKYLEVFVKIQKAYEDESYKL